MKIQTLLRVAALGVSSCAFPALAGCGGGGTSATPVVTRAPALAGTVQAPQSQTRAVKTRVYNAASDPLVNVSGATVSLINLDDAATANGSVVGTTTTDSSGGYSFPTVTPGTNYKIEAVKTFGAKTLTLDAIVTAPAAAAAGTAAPAAVPHDLTPNTTVAAVAVIQQVQALKAADPTANQTNLQSLADDLVKKRVDANTPPPDCTDPAAVTTDANTLKQSAAPIGSYTGLAVTTFVADKNANQKVGDTTRLAAQIDSTGHFFLVAFSSDNKSQGSGAAAASTGTGNGTGTGTGNGSGHTDNGEGNIAIGAVTADGIVNATTKDGSIKVVGIYTSGVATGTFGSVDGSQKGVWSLTLLKNTYSGLYAGIYTSNNNGQTGGGNNSGNGTGSGGNNGNSGGSGSGGLNLGISSTSKGDFALLALDDNTALIISTGHDGGSAVKGTGTVSASGAVTFSITSSDGTTVTGTGQINTDTHTLSGTYSSTSGETGQFNGRSNHAVTTDL